MLFCIIDEQKECATTYFSEEFNYCTIAINGTHTPMVLYPTRGEMPKPYYSFKLKAAALNTQVSYNVMVYY
jgi:hypothetical protein